MKTIGIVGSRRRDGDMDFEKIAEAFFKIYEKGDRIVSGGCPKGGDRFAEIIAAIDAIGPLETTKIDIIIHLPDKSKLDPVLLKKNPRAAYAIINYTRNTLIAQDSDFLIACVAENRKGGTEDTIKKFIKLHGSTNLILV